MDTDLEDSSYVVFPMNILTKKAPYTGALPIPS